MRERYGEGRSGRRKDWAVLSMPGARPLPVFVGQRSIGAGVTKSRILVHLLVIASASIALLGGSSFQPRSLVLDNVRVIDGSGAPPIERARIVIESGRI